jgi:hypothetical protein
VSGLNTELVRQQENLRAVEASSLATWDGAKYTMDLADLEAKVGTRRMTTFKASLQKEYGGDILTGLRDGFRRIYDVTDVVQSAGLYNLDAANDRRNSIGVIQGALNTLNPIDDSAVVNTIGEAVARGDVSRAGDAIYQRDANIEVKAPEIKTIGLGSQGTEVGTKEKPYDTPRTGAEFDRIPVGGLFIGRNGEIRTKRKERNK